VIGREPVFPTWYGHWQFPFYYKKCISENRADKPISLSTLVSLSFLLTA